MHHTRRRKSRQQVESHPVAELVHAALVAQQQEEQDAEKVAAAQLRPRRKRAPRRRQRPDPEGDTTVSNDANQDETTTVSTAAGSKTELEITLPTTAPTPRRRKRLSKCKSSVLREREKAKACSELEEQTPPCCRFLVRNLVTQDEVGDPDELEELEDDTRAEFAQFGALTQLRICGLRDDDDGEDDTAGSAVGLTGSVLAGDVVVEFEGPQSAVAAFTAHNGRVFGGRPVSCLWLPDPAVVEEASTSAVVRVGNMVAPDELEDDDEFDDVQDEVASLFERYGAVQRIEICRASGVITVEFAEVASARQAIENLNNSVYGGRSVAASLAKTEFVRPVQTSDGDAVIAAPKRDRVMAVTVRCAMCMLCLRRAS